MASQELYSEDRLDFALKERHKPLMRDVEIMSTRPDGELTVKLDHDKTDLFEQRTGVSHPKD